MLSLHRSIQMTLNSAKPGATRAFAISLEIGLGTKDPASVDGDSGMLINLVEVDKLLAALVNELKDFSQQTKGSVFLLVQHALSYSHSLLAEENGIFVSRLCFTEKRGEFFGWEREFFYGRNQHLEVSEELVSVKSTYRVTVSPASSDAVSADSDPAPNFDFTESIPVISAEQVPPINARTDKKFSANFDANLIEIEIEHSRSGERTRYLL